MFGNIFHVSDPSIRAEYEATLPSKQQRRDNFGNRPAMCWGCEKYIPRAELRVCARCKTAQYYNRECQRNNWRATHKQYCSPATNPHPTDITLKLAERFMSDPYMVSLLMSYSVLCLDLLNDRSNANRFAVNVICTTGPADMIGFMQRFAPGEDISLNEPLRLVISSIRRVPLEEAPPAVQKAAAESQQKGTRDPVTNMPIPSVALYMSCSQNAPQGQNISEILAVPAIGGWFLDYMADKPTLTVRSPMLGDRVVDMDMPAIQETMDDYIASDKDNILRLRVYPNGTPLPTKTTPQK